MEGDNLKVAPGEGSFAQSTFYYLDPPFMEKAERLYRFYFARTEHARMRDYLTTLQTPWLVSYDASPAVAHLYCNSPDLSNTQVELLYSTSAADGRRAAREFAITNLPCLPVETRLWRRSREWMPRGLH